MRGYSARTGPDGHTVWTPRTPWSGYGVALCHGSNAPNEFMDLAAQAASVRLAAAIASRGIPCVAGPWGGDLWGNDAQCATIDAARAALASANPSMSTGKVLLLGVSAGAAMAVRYALERPGQAAGIVGIIPALDIKALWEQVPAVRAPIGAAYGATYPAALPAEADTFAQAASLTGVPQLYGYSTVDAIVPPATVTVFAAASGGTATVIDTSTGHSDATVAKMPLADVLSFLLEHGA